MQAHQSQAYAKEKYFASFTLKPACPYPSARLGGGPGVGWEAGLTRADPASCTGPPPSLSITARESGVAASESRAAWLPKPNHFESSEQRSKILHFRPSPGPYHLSLTELCLSPLSCKEAPTFRRDGGANRPSPRLLAAVRLCHVLRSHSSSWGLRGSLGPVSCECCCTEPSAGGGSAGF